MIENQNLIHHLLIIDEAIDNIEPRELIYHVNQSIHGIRTEAIRNEHQDHRITLYISSNRGLRCLYASTTAVIAPLIHIENFNKLPCKSNIYDAIGVGIGTMKVAAYRAQQPVRKQITIFSSCTDNISQKYSACNLKSLVTMLRGLGWFFSYVGFSALVPVLAKEIGIDMCCVLKSNSQIKSRDSILGILKRQWILKNPEGSTSIVYHRKKIETA
ncbi:MAG: hypothetical protein ACI9FN_001234 [Saprospiraceae bacterium]|jgi:hypothetical protein